MTTTTLVGSKPDLIPQLRAKWRKSAEHAAEQLARFVRLTVIAAIPSLSSVVFSQHFDWKTLLAFILPIAEVAWRQVFPALGAAKVDSADGVTIVPEQVGVVPDPVPDVDPVPDAPDVEDDSALADAPLELAPPVKKAPPRAPRKRV